MRITELTADIVTVPMKHVIRHASHARVDSDNIIVRCRLDDGTFGVGEGVPRSYVTGETASSAMGMFSTTTWDPIWDTRIDGWTRAIELIDTLPLRSSTDDPRGCQTNALRCAVELSILDAVGRRMEQPLANVIESVPECEVIHERRDRARYSTAITAQSAASERKSAIKMRLYGFRQCKVKVGVEGQDDVQRLRRIRSWLGRRVDIRIDANEAWSVDEAAARIGELEPMSVTCVEQPIAHEAFDALPDLRRDIKTDIMLDESLTSEVDAQAAIDSGACDCFNIRLSKCGGYIRCLRLAALARASGLSFQLGCHPGETPILSAAGRHFATSVKGIRYLEGSYDRHLLADKFASPDITFGFGGLAPRIGRPGLGIAVDQSSLRRNSIDSITLTGTRGESTR
ncbi:MAG: dipeptide epimerase [Planctomycetota bacterium]